MHQETSTWMSMQSFRPCSRPVANRETRLSPSVWRRSLRVMTPATTVANRVIKRRTAQTLPSLVVAPALAAESQAIRSVTVRTRRRRQRNRASAAVTLPTYQTSAKPIATVGFVVPSTVIYRSTAHDCGESSPQLQVNPIRMDRLQLLLSARMIVRR